VHITNPYGPHRFTQQQQKSREKGNNNTRTGTLHTANNCAQQLYYNDLVTDI